MTQYECRRDGPWVLTYPQGISRLPKQSLEAVVHIQLLEEDLHQRRRPPKHGGCGNRRTNRPRSNISAPAFRRCVCRIRATPVLARARSAPGSRRRWSSGGRFCLGRLSARGHGRSWDWRHSAESHCFTASAIRQRLALHEFAGLSRATPWRKEQVWSIRYPECDRGGKLLLAQPRKLCAGQPTPARPLGLHTAVQIHPDARCVRWVVPGQIGA